MHNSIKKIAITGPESTGKSWLSEELANYYHADWIPEFAREYLVKNGLQYSIEDLVEIAKGQVKSQKLAEKNSSGILFSDTELVVLKIWSKVVFQNCPIYIDKMLSKQQFDLYLLCYPDIPWEFHPMRENPDNRDYLFTLYEQELLKNQFNYRIVKGIGEERLKNAITFVNEVLK